MLRIYLKGLPVSPSPNFRGTRKQCEAMIAEIERTEPMLKGKLEARR